MPRSRGNRSTAVVVRSVVVGRKKGKKKSRGKGKYAAMAASSMPGCDCTLEYFQSLVDPFEHGLVKLGWGCMVPTTNAQAYFRSSIVTGTDGSLTIAVLPSVSGSIVVWNTAAATVNSTSAQAFSNAPAITANCGEGRVVSVGIRAFPNIALTSVPGVAYSGATVAGNYGTINALSTLDFIALPTSHQSIGVSGVSATGRPIDPESFIFYTTIVDALGWTGGVGTVNTSRSMPYSVPYVCFLGLPASSQVFVEVVLNIEATQAVAHSAQTILPDAGGLDGAETVGDHWANPETLLRRMAAYLPHPGRAGEAAASKDVSYLAAVWSGLKGVGKILGPQLLQAGVQRLLTGSTPSQKLIGSGPMNQRYGRQYAGYLE
jgi:hypothetical protein